MTSNILRIQRKKYSSEAMHGGVPEKAGLVKWVIANSKETEKSIVCQSVQYRTNWGKWSPSIAQRIENNGSYTTVHRAGGRPT